jgi:hypothetical protein
MAPERKTLRPLVCCIACEDLEPGAKKLELHGLEKACAGVPKPKLHVF